MKALYRHLNWNDWHLKHHIDHHLGRLTQRRYEALVQGKNVEKESIPVYTPDRWLVGQLPTKSNICGRKWTQTRFFKRCQNADHSDAPFFASSGPIAVAPAAWNGHASFGRSHGQRTRWLRRQLEEARQSGLANLCEKAMRFPAIDPKIPDGQLAKQLKSLDRNSESRSHSRSNSCRWASIRIYADSQHLYEALVTRCESSQSIAQSKPRFDPFKIEVADIQANGSQPAMTPATNYSVRF